MKKLSFFAATVLLMAALLPAARAQAPTYDKMSVDRSQGNAAVVLMFSVDITPGGVTVSLANETAPLVELKSDSFLRMVSKAYPISFEQADDVSGLVKIAKESYQDAKYGVQYIHPEALEALEELVSDAKDAGFRRTRLVETHRTSKIQQQRFNESVAWRVRDGMGEQAAYEAAHLVTALPGESEHHLGMTLDILQRGDSMAQSFGKTKFAKWLADNASKYGFIIRYPDGMQEITGISYEPWHLRFVGETMAEAIDDMDACMETFYQTLKAQRIMQVGDDALIVYVPAGASAKVSASLANGARFSETGEGGRVLVVMG